ncbi:PsbP domain-containing protein 7, chloroplastic [Porphyridium purpureum]|uniref:PsbP domain-containing protein 7, chloroplastic n=1 Tax=Porphyridium purpureum TaxID=35688 RepID=A0A5J4Z5K1_PORPP|nr:PsbP domain-containing protein 7, chloroplastic [Porphyridium purpureum]|eukprot:POR9367..scf295_1
MRNCTSILYSNLGIGTCFGSSCCKSSRATFDSRCGDWHAHESKLRKMIPGFCRPLPSVSAHGRHAENACRWNRNMAFPCLARSRSQAVKQASPRDDESQNSEQRSRGGLYQWLLQNPDELQGELRRRVISRRRLLAASALAVLFTFGGNFLNLTSLLLSLFPPAVVEKLKVDQIYAYRGYKRFVAPDNEFEFVYPKDWVEDQAVYLFTQSSKARQLDYSMRDKAKKIGIVPSAAFGPPGSVDGSTNVSVIQTKVLPGFSMERTLGTPEYAGQWLLDNQIAPPNSGKKASLSSATMRPQDGAYVIEFTVRGFSGKEARPFEAHNVAVVAFSEPRQTVYTLTVVTKQALWDELGEACRTIASSFRLQ